MTGLPGFHVDIDQNPYLPVGGRDVSAIVTVTADATGGGPAAAAPDGGSAEIVIIDCSGSMDYPQAKIAEARAATAAAVDVIRDGTWFAIVAGTSTAWPVYPADGSMAVAGERTRAEAKAALRQLRASGGHRDRPVAAAGEPDLPGLARPRCGTPSCSLTGRTSTRSPRSSPRRSPCARARSAATAGASARTGRSASCARSPPRCSAASTSWWTRPGWPPTSRN